MAELDVDSVIQRMVRALHARPAEWLTFGYLARLVGMSSDLLAAIAENRPDVFAMSGDRKLKLRENTVERIAHVGIINWKPPEAPPPLNPQRSPGSTKERATGRCYCNSLEADILNDLLRGSIPEEALVRTCCWKEICRVRGLHFNSVDPETWREICQQRGYILARENPRGF